MIFGTLQTHVFHVTADYGDRYEKFEWIFIPRTEIETLKRIAKRGDYSSTSDGTKLKNELYMTTLIMALISRLMLH